MGLRMNVWFFHSPIFKKDQSKTNHPRIIKKEKTKQIAPLSGAICDKMGNNKASRIKQEIESLPDSISS